MIAAATRWLRDHARPVATFALVLLVYCIFVGPTRLLEPSANNHYTWLAEGWLHGRLHLEGEPPGYCNPKERRRGCKTAHDDWARLYELERDDRTTFWGFPCRTKDCKALARERKEKWYVPGEGWETFARGDVRKTGHERWYVSFPPGPAVLFLPFVALAGFAFADIAFTCLLGALIPAVLLHFFDRERGPRGEHLWLTAALAFGSPLFFVAVNGSVWFTAQVTGTLFLVLYLCFATRAERPALAGACLAMATATRPFLLLAIFYIAFEWWRAGRSPAAIVRFFAPLVVAGLLVAAHNYARFSDPFEFGHRYLDIAWQPRMQEVGILAVDYFPRNLRCLLWLMPAPSSRFPGFKVSVHGVAIWLSSPWVLLLPLAFLHRFPERRGLLFALVLAIPALFYQNSGQLQYAHRFAVDWLPLVLALLALSRPKDNTPGSIRRFALPALVLFAIAFNAWGAWHYHEKPGLLFVGDPPLWPFEEEMNWRG